MAALRSRCGHYIFALWFLLQSIFLFSSPNLSGRRVDVYHTSTHGVTLVRIHSAGLKCAVLGSLEIQDAKMTRKIAIWAPLYNFVGAESLQLRHVSTIKKLVKQQLLHMSS